MSIDERRLRLLMENSTYGSLPEKEGYTLLYFGKDKVVNIKLFRNKNELLDFKRYNNYLKKSELKPLDSDGFIWYVEVEE